MSRKVPLLEALCRCPQELEKYFVVNMLRMFLPSHASPPDAYVVKLWDPPDISEYWSMEGTGVGWETKADSSTMAKLLTCIVLCMGGKFSGEWYSMYSLILGPMCRGGDMEKLFTCICYLILGDKFTEEGI